MLLLSVVNAIVLVLSVVDEEVLVTNVEPITELIWLVVGVPI